MGSLQLPIIRYDWDNSKLMLWSDLCADMISCMTTITIGTLRHWKSGAFVVSKTHRYMAMIEEINHSLEGVHRDYKEITLFQR